MLPAAVIYIETQSRPPSTTITAAPVVDGVQQQQVELISDSILGRLVRRLGRNSGSEMRSEAISLTLCWMMAVLVPLGQGAVDIFSGMNDGGENRTKPPEPARDDPEEHHLQSCMTDIYEEEPIPFDGQILSLTTIDNALKEIPGPPAMPDIGRTVQRFKVIFQLPRFSEMGEELKTIMDEVRNKVNIYIQQWMGLFKKRHRNVVEKIKAEVQQMNGKIRDSFANEFEEFKDVCLPETNQCLQSIQTGLDGYNERLNRNMAACNEFVKRQVSQHERWVGNEAQLLERPLLRIAGCFEGGRVGLSLVSCVGNMVSNSMKGATDGLKRFSEAMEAASVSLENRMGKFQECVVNRKKLLDRGQMKIAERAKQCLRSQPAGEGEIFGGDHEDDF